MTGDTGVSGAHAPRSLAKVLGVGFALAATVGGMVGQGIMRSPGVVAGAVPDPALILALWFVVGLLCLVDACSHVEMSASTRQAGGPYVFAERAFGPIGGALTGWADALNIISAIAFVAVVSAEFLQRLGPLSGTPVGVLAPAVIAVFTALNWAGARVGGISQTVGSLLKGLALILIVGLLFASHPAERAPAAAVSPALGLAALAVALRAIRNTYDGWNAATYFSEEMPDPGRDLPRTVFGGIVLVTVLYTGVNAALLHALTPAQMAASNLPAAEAMRGMFGDGAEQITSLFAAISVLAITNLYLMFCPRILFAMGRSGVLPRALGVPARNGSPNRALLAAAVPAALLAVTGSYPLLLAVATPAQIVVNLLVNAAALRARRTEPDAPRPFRTPFFPWPILVSTAINAALLVVLVIEQPGPALALPATVAAATAISLLFARRAQP